MQTREANRHARLSVKTWGLIGLASLAVLSPPTWALEQAQTPTQVVQHWITVYPKDLNTAVTLTTINLRQGWSQKEWVRTKKAPLALTQLRYLNGEVLSEEITGIQAIVMVKAHISTIVGEQMQRERYRLLRVNGQWLIDDVTVVAERFLGKVM